MLSSLLCERRLQAGVIANGPKGISVLRTDTAADIEVIRITDDRFGTPAPVLLLIFKYCLTREDL